MTDSNALPAPNAFLAIVPALPDAKRCAIVIFILLLVTFCVVIPFVRLPLPRIEPFVPIYEATLALNFLVTAGFLFVGFKRSRLRAVLVLAGGYLFISLLGVAHTLTFPGLFSSSGLLGAGAQTSAWLEVLRHGVFPLFVICYAELKRHASVGARSQAGARTEIVSTAAGAVAGVGLLTLIVTTGHPLLPRIVNGEEYTTLMVAVSLSVLLLGFSAVAVLGQRPPYSILDLWLMLVLGAWMFDAALSTVINAGRFDIGFYAGRLYGLFAAIVVPIVLLIEASRLYSRLDEALAIAEERNAELARSREELAQAQRLEAIVQLTGGVAHDFNNLLTVVIGNLDLMLGARGCPERIERLAQGAMNAAHRGEHLVRQLLTYARRQINYPQTVDANELIASIENLMRRVTGDQIEVSTVLRPGLAPVRIDPAQFETAMLNLAVNSRDAMTGGGRITIETRHVRFDRRHAANDPEVTPGSYVMISVSDTGAGMTPAVLARAFDPFFTTKEVGKGSGLGLSQVYGFAKAAGGYVKIESEPGVGTTVGLYLPESSDRPILPEPPAEVVLSQPVDGRGTILVVEDDEDVLTVTAESLREFGYQVVTAVDAAGALEVLRGGQQIDLLFSDVVLPGGTNGAMLAIEARQIRPGLKVLLTSGYTAAALSIEYGLPDNLNLVCKPYQREELAKRLRLAIGR